MACKKGGGKVMGKCGGYGAGRRTGSRPMNLEKLINKLNDVVGDLESLAEDLYYDSGSFSMNDVAKRVGKMTDELGGITYDMEERGVK